MDNLQSSALVLACVGILIAWARNLPPKIGKAIARQSLASVYSRDSNLVRQLGIAAIELWGVRSKWIAASLKTNRERSDVSFEPARGWHFVRWQDHIILLNRGKEDGPPGASTEARAILAAETITLYASRRNAQWLQSAVQEAAEFGQRRLNERGAIRIANQWGDWIDLEGSLPRPIGSVILPAGIADDLLERVKVFLTSPQWYAERGIPWRLGIGIFGPPGTGKSSLVRAVCSEAGLTLHIPDITGKNASDAGLMQSLARLGPRAAVIFDDLDAARLPSREEASGGITLAGLLGAFCGPGAAEGRVLFVCSNNPEKLDPALLRGGRIDIRIDLGPATHDQARRLYEVWYPGDQVGAARFARDGAGKAMAELQSELRSGAHDSLMETSAWTPERKAQ